MVSYLKKTIITRIAKLLYRFSQKYADKVFFQNEDDRQFFINNGIVRPEITDRLPGSGVDLSRFKMHPANDDGIVRFLLIARMLYDKGVLHYIEAARTLKNRYGNGVEFRLLGFLDVNNPSAVSRSQMQAWVEEGIVCYLGVSDAVENELSIVDCVVLPSYYREGVPKSLLEAGAMGKPIITTNSVGCRETVDHAVNGFLCDPKSTESLATMLDKFINLSYQQRISMGQASRSKMESEFDEQIVINKYISSIKELLANPL